MMRAKMYARVTYLDRGKQALASTVISLPESQTIMQAEAELYRTIATEGIFYPEDVDLIEIVAKPDSRVWVIEQVADMIATDIDAYAHSLDPRQAITKFLCDNEYKLVKVS